MPFNPHAAIAGRRLLFDPERRLTGFEKVETSLERRDRLISRLRRGNSADINAADCLGTCHGHRRLRSEEACLSAACPICMRAMRRWFTAEAALMALRQRVRHDTLGHVVTVIPAGWRVPVGNLQHVSLGELRSAAWRWLHKALPQSVVVGGIDISLNESGSAPDQAHYQAHFAAAFLGPETPDQLRRALTGVIPPEPTARRPIMIQPLRDLVSQISYLFKARFTRRVSLIDRAGRPFTRQFDLKAPQLTEIGAWLAPSALEERVLLHGCRRRGNHLRLTGRSPKRQFRRSSRTSNP